MLAAQTSTTRLARAASSYSQGGGWRPGKGLRIGNVSPRTRVLALSMHKDSMYVREFLRAGARGYLLKDSGDADLVAAVRAIAKGDGYISPRVSDAVPGSR
jgi:DNA-binding NarL/FixJ family response regulator